jgi:quercetin dioxygenase-like cupin family protein
VSSEGIEALRVMHLPAGVGPSWWVYGDKDIMEVTGEDTGGTLSVVETVVPPHGGPPPHIHHNEHEAFYVIEGDFEVLDNDRTITVGPGAFVYMPKGSLHYFKNLHDEPKRLLLLFFPAGFQKYLMEVGQPVAEGQTTPPSTGTDLAQAGRIGAKYGLEIVQTPPRK